MYFFVKHLIVLYDANNNFRFGHLYQIHIFNNNFNENETITSHLTFVITRVIYDKNFTTFMLQHFIEKNTVIEKPWQNHTWQNHSIIAKIRILPTRQQEVVVTSKHRFSVCPSEVAGTSQMKNPTTSHWNVFKTFQWYLSTTSYWNVLVTS